MSFSGSAPPPMKRGPLKLGALDVAVAAPASPSQKFDQYAMKDLENPFAPKKRPMSLGLKFFVSLVAIVIVGTVVVGALYGTGLVAASENSSPTTENSGSDGGSGSVGSDTILPTVAATFRPTRAPVIGVTSSPTGPTTARPTLKPSSAPTLSPIAGCVDPDAICGCDQVVSELIDVVFILDESGSVTQKNYDISKTAIRNFSNVVVPPFGENGTRIGYIEFASSVDESSTIELFTFENNLTAWQKKFNLSTYSKGGTNHKVAITRVNTMLKSTNNALRDGSQRAVVMITDGFPDSAAVSGRTELKELAGNFSFTYYYVPIGKDANLTQYDGILPADRFVRFNNTDFEGLNELLNGGNLSFPLGPCVAAPAVSRAAVRLLTEDVNLIPKFMEDEGSFNVLL